jgi:exodeoxyribonuclease (lambda-induced)
MEQRSDEWFEIRKGKMTASEAQCISANGKGLETYAYKVVAEKYSSNHESFSNRHTERGVELEESAKMTYEIEKEAVEIVGFIEMNEFAGCSPDGLVGSDGGLEIKCPDDVGYFKILVDREKAIESKYLWQVQMCLLISERKWWDLMFYNPNFEQNNVIFRIYPELSKQEKLIMGIEKGKNIIKELEKKYGDRKI